MSAHTVVDHLSRAPVTIAHARLPPDRGGVPPRPGVYAWWVAPNAVPGIPIRSDPDGSLAPLYVGIAPSRGSSTSTLRSRILRQHVGGNTGSSTFRLSLAALLYEAAGWNPQKRGRKVMLSADDNAALTRWQEEQLRLTWFVHESPWQVEEELIRRLAPALNLASNAASPLHSQLSTARRRLRAAAITEKQRPAGGGP